MLLRTWKVTCPILCNLCYRGFGGLVVLYFFSDVIENLECYLSCTFYLCYRGVGRLVVLYFAIDVMENLEC